MLKSPLLRAKFLLDENVRVELDAFLKARNIDCRRLSRGTADTGIAATSLKEDWIVVTNDADFTLLAREEIYGVVWTARIRQRDLDSLLAGFGKLFKEARFDPAGKLIILEPNSFEEIPLLSITEFKK